MTITSASSSCTLSADTIPNHDFNDESASFATDVAQIERSFTIIRNPVMASSSTEISQSVFDAAMLNGVVLDLLSAGCYNPSSSQADSNGNVASGSNA